MKSLYELQKLLKEYTTCIQPNMWGKIFLISLVEFFLFGAIKNIFRRGENHKKIWDEISLFLLVFEGTFILSITLLGREHSAMTWEWIPFRSWYTVVLDNNIALLTQILANIILFIPFGFLLPCCFAKCRKYRYTVLYAALLSLVIELIQGIAQIGLFETDDIIHNTLGACIGVGCYMAVASIRKKWRG